MYRPAPDVLSEARELAGILDKREKTEGKFRVYSPSYSMPQQTAALFGLELADGVEPLQLQDYVRFMEAASGVPVRGYSVTLPPMDNSLDQIRSGATEADPHTVNAAYSPDAYLLGLLNVRYIVAEFDLDAPGFEMIERVDNSRLYFNSKALPRAWIEKDGIPIQEPTDSVEILQWAPDLIRIRAYGPGQLVISELDYPGWKARLDGKPAVLDTSYALLRGVQLPGGVHDVVFVYRPWTVTAGLFLAALGLGLILNDWTSRQIVKEYEIEGLS